MKVSACVIFPEGEDLRDWRESLPQENIEIVAIETSINPKLKEPIFTYVGRTSDHVVLAWEVPDFENYWDFGYLRNKLNQHATGDWIVHIDSDERLAMTHEQFWENIKALEETDAVAAGLTIVGMRSELDERVGYVRQRYAGPNLRIIRNNQGVKWKAICHEHLDLHGEDLIVADTDILLWHLGYNLGAEELKDKAERNAKLMIREYTREKSERNWNYLVNTFSYLQQKQEEVHNGSRW
jgi:hypothetical protein